VSFSRQSTAFDVGELDASPTEALLEHAVLVLEVVDHIQLPTIDPTGERHQQQVKRVRQ
jgi:hypothetical protein